MSVFEPVVEASIFFRQHLHEQARGLTEALLLMHCHVLANLADKAEALLPHVSDAGRQSAKSHLDTLNRAQCDLYQAIDELQSIVADR